MKIKRYGVNVSETACQPRENQSYLQSRGLHKAFNKGGIPLLLKSYKSPNKKSCMRKIILVSSEYHQKCTCYKTLITKTNL